jgi:hypothetical protein
VAAGRRRLRDDAVERLRRPGRPRDQRRVPPGLLPAMAGHLDAAAASYDEGRAIAASCGNEAGLLEADVSHAALALHRGNLPAAETLLDGVIRRADPRPAGGCWPGRSTTGRRSRPGAAAPRRRRSTATARSPSSRPGPTATGCSATWRRRSATRDSTTPRGTPCWCWPGRPRSRRCGGWPR